MKPFTILGFILMTVACRDQPKEKTSQPEPAKAPEEKRDYFPVKDFIQGEIAYVDSFPMKMTRYTSSQGHTDSATILLPEFEHLAGEFLDTALDKAFMEKVFTESSFLDQTSQSLTFTYARQDGKEGVKRVDVLASQDPVHDKVKSVYIEKVFKRHDSSITNKMYWKSKRNFQVITISHFGQAPDITRQLKVVWDTRP